MKTYEFDITTGHTNFDLLTNFHNIVPVAYCSGVQKKSKQRSDGQQNWPNIGRTDEKAY